MLDWNALRWQVHALLKHTCDYQPGLTLKAQLRGLTLHEVLAEAITDLVAVAVAADTAAVLAPVCVEDGNRLSQVVGSS
jgi:hypothetical protein